MNTLNKYLKFSQLPELICCYRKKIVHETQKMFALHSHVDIRTIQSWESGKKTPSIESIQKTFYRHPDWMETALNLVSKKELYAAPLPKLKISLTNQKPYFIKGEAITTIIGACGTGKNYFFMNPLFKFKNENIVMISTNKDQVAIAKEYGKEVHVFELGNLTCSSLNPFPFFHSKKDAAEFGASLSIIDCNLYKKNIDPFWKSQIEIILSTIFEEEWKENLSKGTLDGVKSRIPEAIKTFPYASATYNSLNITVSMILKELETIPSIQNDKSDIKLQDEIEKLYHKENQAFIFIINIDNQSQMYFAELFLSLILHNIPSQNNREVLNIRFIFDEAANYLFSNIIDFCMEAKTKKVKVTMAFQLLDQLINIMSEIQLHTFFKISAFIFMHSNPGPFNLQEIEKFQSYKQNKIIIEPKLYNKTDCSIFTSTDKYLSCKKDQLFNALKITSTADKTK